MKVIEALWRVRTSPTLTASVDRFTSAPDVPTVRYAEQTGEVFDHIIAYPAVPAATAGNELAGMESAVTTPSIAVKAMGHATVNSQLTKSEPVGAESPLTGIGPE